MIIEEIDDRLDEYVESWFADDYCASPENHERNVEYIPSDV